MMRSRRLILSMGILLLGISCAFAQQPQAQGQAAQAQARPAPAPAPPPLFFNEVWKTTPQGGQHPVTPDSLSSPNLELKLYGDGKNVLMNERNPPLHLFTGACETNCAVAFREKNNYVDLTGHARIRWVRRTPRLPFVPRCPL